MRVNTQIAWISRVSRFSGGGGFFREVVFGPHANHPVPGPADDSWLQGPPGSDPNSVNVLSNGLIPVAVLTTSGVDASSVDPLTVRFERTGTEAMPVRSGLEDTDRDGDLDLMLHFKVEETGIQAGDSEARLTGRTFGGSMITGSDMVRAFFPGDVNGDLVVDVLDLALLGAAFGSVAGSASWNPYADFDENGIINVLDLVIVGRYFGQYH